MWIWSASYPAPRAVIISLPSLTAPADCAPALFQGWIAHFGVPEAIISDCGLQFTSSIWAALCQLLNNQHPAHADHCIPSRGQWHGGEVSRQPEGCPMYPLPSSRLDGPSPLGHAWAASHPTRGQCCHPCLGRFQICSKEGGNFITGGKRSPGDKRWAQ